MKKLVTFLLCVAVLGCASCKKSDSSRKALSGSDASSSSADGSGAENNGQSDPDASAPIAINGENFGSSAFRDTLRQNFDINTDGFLDAGEIAEIKVLDIHSDVRVFSMKGLGI